MRALLLLSAAALCAGCMMPVQSSAVATGPAVSPAPSDRPQAARPDPGKPQPGSPPPPPIAVRVAAEPAGAREVGVAEAHGREPLASLELLVAELQRRAAELGGDTVKVDSFRTRYELVDESYTYDCGRTETTTETQTQCTSDGRGGSSCHPVSVSVTRHVYRSCTGTRKVEVGVRSLVGRAFRAAPANSQETP